MSLEETVERGIHVFELVGNVGLSDIGEALRRIEELRAESPDLILYEVDETSHLYLSDNGVRTHRGKPVFWAKFGWARRGGLPETLNVRRGTTEFLRLPSGTYLYEPAHFIIFSHNDRVMLLHEFNFFAPRASRLAEYLVKYLRELPGKEDANLYARRVFMRDLDKVLRGYRYITSMRIEIKARDLHRLSQVLGGSKTNLQSLDKGDPERIAITLISGRGETLNLSISEVLDLFYSIEDVTPSFKLKVKRRLIGRATVIDLKKQFLIFRKRFRYVRIRRKGEDIVYRSTDTENAIDVLVDTIDEAIEAIS